MKILDWISSRVKRFFQETAEFCYGCGEQLGATRVLVHERVYCSGVCAGYRPPAKPLTDAQKARLSSPAPCKGGPRSAFLPNALIVLVLGLASLVAFAQDAAQDRPPVKLAKPTPACGPSLPIGTVCRWQGGIPTDLPEVDVHGNPLGPIRKAVVLIDFEQPEKAALRKFAWSLRLDTAPGDPVCLPTNFYAGVGIIQTDCEMTAPARFLCPQETVASSTIGEDILRCSICKYLFTLHRPTARDFEEPVCGSCRREKEERKSK